MKIVTKLTLLAIVMASMVMSGRLRGKPGPTPKAADLGDHFGTEPVKNLYGPKPVAAPVNLMREGVTGKDTPITPINNFYKEVTPTSVTSGGLDNTSYDASKIIRPIIAGNLFKYFIFSLFHQKLIMFTPLLIILKPFLLYFFFIKLNFNFSRTQIRY